MSQLQINPHLSSKRYEIREKSVEQIFWEMNHGGGEGRAFPILQCQCAVKQETYLCIYRNIRPALFHSFCESVYVLRFVFQI